MPALAQPRGGRGQPERLPPQFVRRDENDVHDLTSIAARRADSISVIIDCCTSQRKEARMAISRGNSFGTRDKLHVGAQIFDIHRLEFLEKRGISNLGKLPFSLRILLENL